MAIGTTFDTLQQAILAEDELALRKANAFRDYLARQSANRNQGRQVGVNEFDAQTRRGLGFRNADEQALDREARYGYLDRELGVRDRNFGSNLEYLRDQLRQRKEADDERLRLDAEKAWLLAGQQEGINALSRELGLKQLEMQGKYYDAQLNPPRSEAFTAEALSMIADEEDKERRGDALANLINSKARSKMGWFTGPEKAFDAAFSEVASGPMAKDIGLVRFDAGLGRYVPAVSAANLRKSLLEQRNPRIKDQTLSIEPPKPAGADFSATKVGGKWVISGASGSPELDPRTADHGEIGGMTTTEWIPESRSAAESVESVINGGAPTPVDQGVLYGHTPESYKQALSQEFRRRLVELGRTPAGTAPLLAPLYSDIARRRSVEPTRIGQSTMFRTPQAQIRDMANSQEIAAWEAGLSPEDWSALFRSALAESYRNPTRGYENFVYGQ